MLGGKRRWGWWRSRGYFGGGSCRIEARNVKSVIAAVEVTRGKVRRVSM